MSDSFQEYILFLPFRYLNVSFELLSYLMQRKRLGLGIFKECSI